MILESYNKAIRGGATEHEALTTIAVLMMDGKRNFSRALKLGEYLLTRAKRKTT